MRKTVVAAIDMGYGHLRPAAALADHLGTEVLQMDQPPLGHARDRAFWNPVRTLYEPLTRLSQMPAIGLPLRTLLNTITAIPPLWPFRDLSGPSQGTRWMRKAAKIGVGRGPDAVHLAVGDHAVKPLGAVQLGEDGSGVKGREQKHHLLRS